MIDKNGNKIINNNTNQDPTFIFNEIRFLMKSFNKDQNDKLALAIASRITTYVILSDNPDAIIDILIQLEKYVDLTASDDFIWELIYARREISKKQPKTKEGHFYSAVNRHISAKHFHSLCRIKPTTKMYHGEIIELTIAARDYTDAHYTDTASQLLHQAREIYEELKERPTEEYYDLGKYLYLEMIRYCTDLSTEPELLDIYLKLLYTLQQLYKLNHEKDILRLMALTYSECLSLKSFCFEKEQDNIDELITLINQEIDKGDPFLKSSLKKLKRSIKYRKM